MNKELVFKKEMRAFDINVDDIKPDEHIFGAIEEAIIKHEALGCEYKHIAEEIADVLNMVEQFMYYYDIDIRDVIEIKHQKINRQLERIENEKDNNNV